jgi:hypothetical protein
LGFPALLPTTSLLFLLKPSVPDKNIKSLIEIALLYGPRPIGIFLLK